MSGIEGVKPTEANERFEESENVSKEKNVEMLNERQKEEPPENRDASNQIDYTI